MHDPARPVDPAERSPNVHESTSDSLRKVLRSSVWVDLTGDQLDDVTLIARELGDRDAAVTDGTGGPSIVTAEPEVLSLGTNQIVGYAEVNIGE
jgi:hypothetical protein